MSICLRLGTVGRYCVTKDTIQLSSLHFCGRTCFLFSNLMCECSCNQTSGVSSFNMTCSKMRDFSFESIFRGVCMGKSKCFALDEALFDP